MTMSETTTPTPPECCPICGDRIKETGEAFVTYVCGATWATYRTMANRDHPWHYPCRHAFTAALRCHATLEPTPREQARDALVEAAVKWRNAVYEVANSDSAGLEDAHFERARAADNLLNMVKAYRALLEPRP